MTKKHLSFDERATIQIALKECKSFREIAVEVNKSPSTISREVRNHFVIERKGTYKTLPKAVYKSIFGTVLTDNGS